MKLIVGLGHPGILYAGSRHNIGYSVIKALSKIYKVSPKRDRGTFSLTAKTKIDSQNVILALPLTFMNLSGNAVRDLLKKYKIDLTDLLVVCDDLDLELGRQKLRPGGSSAGQRGLQSIIESLRSNEFNRLRLGIGRPPRGIDPSEYVLMQFSRKEKELAKEMIASAVSCCQSWVTKGTTETMNIFNKRPKESSHA